MGPLLSIIILVVVVAIIYRVFSLSSQKEDLQVERSELKSDLKEMINELETLDQIIEQPEVVEINTENKLRRLKTQLASHRLDLKNTINKVKVEGERNWGYRKAQAKRSLKKTRNFTTKELVEELS